MESIKIYTTADDKKKKIIEYCDKNRRGFFLYFVDKTNRFNAGGWPLEPGSLFKQVYKLSFEDICLKTESDDYVLIDLFDLLQAEEVLFND